MYLSAVYSPVLLCGGGVGGRLEAAVLVPLVQVVDLVDARRAVDGGRSGPAQRPGRQVLDLCAGATNTDVYRCVKRVSRIWGTLRTFRPGSHRMRRALRARARCWALRQRNADRLGRQAWLEPRRIHVWVAALNCTAVHFSVSSEPNVLGGDSVTY